MTINVCYFFREHSSALSIESSEIWYFLKCSLERQNLLLSKFAQQKAFDQSVVVSLKVIHVPPLCICIYTKSIQVLLN